MDWNLLVVLVCFCCHDGIVAGWIVVSDGEGETARKVGI